MKLSEFGERFAGHSGIVQLMDDLGKAMSENKDMLMLGGGNPAHIPEVQNVFQERFAEILENKEEFNALLGNYDGPAGAVKFRTVLAEMLKEQFGWKLTKENICLTHGSQSAFFTLMNMFAGKCSNGKKQKILLPLIPEYIGYADQGLSDDFFAAYKPVIDIVGDNTFKYRVDFKSIKMTDEIGAICVSRPTNPTGNVLTDSEIEQLDALAKKHKVPLIIDNAYGLPFPDIIFEDATPVWNENIILCMSLSKLGLPGARTGIIIANEEVVKAVSNISSILSLAPGSIGAGIATGLVENGAILNISRNVIKPYYQAKSLKAILWLHRELKGLEYYVHKSEGALFLWLWFKDLPISSYELYERLKKRNVLVVSGHYFYPGLEDKDWQHAHECLRLTYSMDEKVVEEAIKIIADEVRSLY
ncbi:MAG: valine--pyruvate transaminase [Lentisphaeraceae bacterium]|nr:valine--pyruvate transaminase [Lentisphaeraceae bacterium]